MSGHEGVFIWSNKKQTCVVLSSAEAGYVTLAGAAQEAVRII